MPTDDLQHTPSYGTYEDVEQLEKMQKAALAATVRRRSTVSVPIPGGDDVGANIVKELEDIFSRASEGMPLFHKLGGLNGVVNTLRSDVHNGITSDTVTRRREVFGKNELPEEPPTTFFQIYLAAWSDHMIILLSIAALVSLVLGLTVAEPGEKKVNYRTGWIEGFAILCSVLIVTTVSSVNDYRKELKFRKLTEENAAQPIGVIRDGTEQVVDVKELVVGDLVSLSAGLVIPVDGFYVSGMSVVIDESSVTGENDAKTKSAKQPIILTGTVVNTAENAYILACAVGERSFGGKLLMESRGAGTVRPTPLQERLDDLAELIGRIGLAVALLLFTVLSVMEIFRMIFHKPGTDYRHFLDYLLLCVAIVVVAVPEGLPLAVTIALAYSQNRMHDDNNQVRRLRACETMGNATQICSDKTGTLTQNSMSVVQGFVGMVQFTVKRPGDLPEPISISSVDPKAMKLLLEGLAVNTSSEKVLMSTDKEGYTVVPYWKWATDKGNKTDNALLDFTDRVLFKKDETNNLTDRPHKTLRTECRDNGYIIFPFTSDRKRMSVVLKESDGSLLHHVKGGSDRVLLMCNRFMNELGEECEMDNEDRARIQEQVKKLANEANRTIGVAYTRLSARNKELPTEEPSEPLVWLALLGIQDPLRPEVPEAVRKCQMAGVTVRMCTGDNLDTAVAISRQCGIYNPFRGDLAMTGQEFRNLVYDAYGNDARMEKFWPIFERMTVVARCQPLDKQLLVLMLMTRGEIVAVTGDGTNDAPALRLANVGFVMRSGTDIAVKSADIVLLDDNFRSVQRAVVWGRCVNDNIRKFLQLQLTVNYVSVALTFIGSVIVGGASSPLTTVQLLWVNLIMDTLAALALATEQPYEECLKRGPINRKASLISRRMHLTIGVVALYVLAITLSVEIWGDTWLNVGKLGSRQHHTIIFNVFVLSTLFHMFNSRKLYEELNMFEGMFSRSKPFIVIVIFCFLFQVLAVETFGDFMNVTNLRAEQWGICVVLSVIVLFVGVVTRLIPIHEPEHSKEFDPSGLDDDARAMLLKLDSAVEREQMTGEHHVGQHLQGAQRLRARAMWQQVRQHHIKAGRVVNAFRRARTDESAL